jgi:hypothetical protein
MTEKQNIYHWWCCIEKEVFGFIFKYLCSISNVENRIGGVMVKVLASSAVDREFKPRSGQTKDN